jgi:hypothetical protein
VDTSNQSTISFAEVTALQPVGPGRFEADVSEGWTIDGKPHGGYLLAMLGRGATAASRHAHVMTASAHYLHSPDPGPVTIETEILRTGRSATHVRATLRQGSHRCVEALLSTSQLDRPHQPYWDGGLPQRGPLAPDGTVELPPQTPTGTPVAIMEQVTLQLDPTTSSYATGHPSGHGELRGSLALPGSEPFDSVALLFAVDALPPATFDIEPTGWVPTLELTAYVRALPAPGPVQILQRAQLIDGQRVDEVCFVWDSTGRLVAQATQLAGIRLG